MVPLKSMDVNTYPYSDWSSSLLVNGALAALFDHAIDSHYIWYYVHRSLPGRAVSGPDLITPTESPRDFTPSGLGLVHSLAIHYFAYFCRPTKLCRRSRHFKRYGQKRVTITTLQTKPSTLLVLCRTLLEATARRKPWMFPPCMCVYVYINAITS